MYGSTSIGQSAWQLIGPAAVLKENSDHADQL